MKNIAIVGAGVLGGAIAWRLAATSHKVTLYDPTPGGVASPGSLAWLNASFAQDPVYNRLRGDSLVLWEELVAGPNPPPVAFRGTILWEQPHFDLDAILAAQEALGRPARFMDPDEHRSIEPNVPTPPERTLFCPTDGFGLPSEITSWFLDQAQGAGAQMVRGKVDGLAMDGGAVSGVQIGPATHAADAVIVAAGVGLSDLLSPLGLSMAMDNQPGLLVTTTPAKPLVTAMLATDGLHGWQGDDGRFLIGADFGGGDQNFDDPAPHAAALIEKLVSVVPGADGVSVQHHTVRTRPMPADGRPAVGPIGPDGLYVVSTHSGMTLAPILADCVAREVGDGTAEPHLAPYRPDRASLTGG